MQSGTHDVVSFVRKRQTRHAASTPTNRTYKKTSTPKRATAVEQQDCKYCGRQHGTRECPAYGQTCRKCGKKNHFQAKCRATQLSNVYMNEEVLFVGLIGDRSSKAVITVGVGRPRPQSRVQFQMDTGAEGNVLSKKTYCRVPGDSQMKRVQTLDLTRFNKICHPSQRPRWQVDKEAIGLSRVQQCSSTYSPPS